MQLLHSCNQLYRRVSLQRHCAIHSLRSAYNLLAYLLLEEDSVESCHQRTRRDAGSGAAELYSLFHVSKDTHKDTTCDVASYKDNPNDDAPESPSVMPLDTRYKRQNSAGSRGTLGFSSNHSYLNIRKQTPHIHHNVTGFRSLTF